MGVPAGQAQMFSSLSLSISLLFSLSQSLYHSLSDEKYKYMFIFMYVVELFAGPKFALFVLMIGQSLLFLKISFSLQKEGDT